MSEWWKWNWWINQKIKNFNQFHSKPTFASFHFDIIIICLYYLVRENKYKNESESFLFFPPPIIALINSFHIFIQERENQTKSEEIEWNKFIVFYNVQCTGRTKQKDVFIEHCLILCSFLRTNHIRSIVVVLTCTTIVSIDLHVIQSSKTNRHTDAI